MAPRVPVAERRVQSAPLPGARITTRVTPEAAGAGIGRGIQQVGEVVNKIAREEKRKADQIAVLEADRRLGETENRVLYDPEQGVLQKRGRDAFSAPESAFETFDEQVAQIEQGLANDTQRLAFRRTAQTRRLTLDRAVQRHVAGERQAFDKAETDAYLDNEINAGIAAAGDGDRVDLSVARTAAAIRDHGRRQGMPAEWIQGKEAQARSAIRSGVVGRLLAQGQDREAKSYFRAFKDEIEGDELATLEAALEEGSLRGESQRRADAIMAKHDELGTAMEAAKKITEPALRDAVTKRVREDFAVKKRADDQARAETFRTAAQTIEQNGGDLRAIAPTDWIEMDASHRAALETRARQIREGVEPVTNWDRYYDLLNLAAEPATRSQFAQVDLMRHRHELSDVEFKDLAGKQAAVRSGKDAADALDGYRTTKQIVDDAMRAVGMDPTVSDKTSKHDAERVNAFRRDVDQAIIDHKRRTGRAPSTADEQAIVDRLLIEGVVPDTGFRGFFETRKRLFELEPGEDLDVELDAIPAADREQIEQALRRHNLPVTPEAIVDTFRAVHFPRGRPSAEDVEASLTEQERNIVDYHRGNLENPGRDEQGRPVTVFSTGIRISEGPNAGKFVAVPGFVDGSIVRDEALLWDYWRSDILAGKWPIYETGQELNRRSQEIHAIMDAEGDERRPRTRIDSPVPEPPPDDGS